MAITDKHVAVLRAQLTGRRGEHLRLAKQLSPEESNQEYAALVAAGFIRAVERRFIRNEETADVSEVVDFVADLRAIDDEMSDVINPQLAESMILHLLNKGSVADADADTKFGHQIVILATLVGEEQFSTTELDTFLTDARSLGNDLLE